MSSSPSNNWGQNPEILRDQLLRTIYGYFATLTNFGVNASNHPDFSDLENKIKGGVANQKSVDVVSSGISDLFTISLGQSYPDNFNDTQRKRIGDVVGQMKRVVAQYRNQSQQPQQ